MNPPLVRSHRVIGVLLSTFLSTLLVAATFASPPDLADSGSRIKAVVFDGFPIFDPRPVMKTVGTAVGQSKAPLWRQQLFSYQWLRALGGQYRDFLSIADDALLTLVDPRDSQSLEMHRAQLRRALLFLQAWPDAKDGLIALRSRGLTTAILSNMTPEMLRSGAMSSDLLDLIDRRISTHSASTFKPAPQAYSLAIQELGMKKEEICFVAFAGWDAAGASWYGFKTFWMNRLSAPPDRLFDGKAPPTGTTMQDLLQYLDGAERARD